MTVKHGAQLHAQHTCDAHGGSRLVLSTRTLCVVAWPFLAGGVIRVVNSVSVCSPFFVGGVVCPVNSVSGRTEKKKREEEEKEKR